jgi:preprotein translocase subunit SecB
LLENNFKRLPNVVFNNEEVIQDVSVDVDVQIKENKTIFVNEKLLFKQVYKDKIQVEATIIMVGVFEKFGESSLNLEEFGQVNGAAIIFPYIREHLTSLSAKAGLGLILLPPVNLTARKKKEKD